MLVLLDPQISCLWGFSFLWEVPEDSAVLSERALLARWPCSVPPYHPGLGTEGPNPLCVCSQAVPAFVLSTGAYWTRTTAGSSWALRQFEVPENHRKAALGRPWTWHIPMRGAFHRWEH